MSILIHPPNQYITRRSSYDHVKYMFIETIFYALQLLSFLRIMKLYLFKLKKWWIIILKIYVSILQESKWTQWFSCFIIVNLNFLFFVWYNYISLFLINYLYIYCHLIFFIFKGIMQKILNLVQIFLFRSLICDQYKINRSYKK